MKKILLFICFVFTLSACENLFFEKDLATTEPLENFDFLWNEVDKKYSYFELKNINWNEIKNKYRPMLSQNSTDEELFEVLASMLNELRDDHTNLASPFNISFYNIMLKNPKNYNQRTIDEYYTKNVWHTGAFSHDFLNDNNIGYIRYGSFMYDFSDSQLDFILKRYINTKGLIIDMRENGGGSVFNVPQILSRFTQTKTLVGYSITRNGPKHNDFSKRESFYVTPYSGLKYLKPVIILIDRGSYSATTFFALATKALPNITLMGDTTGGGGGLPNGGILPNGWRYRFSVSQLLDINGDNYAEDGVPPDIQAEFDWSDITKDEIIESAILEINK
jgi:C-terminal processing protease CtpA/Prc